MTYNVECLFRCLFSICLSSLVRCLFRSLIHVFIKLFIFLLLILRILCIFWKQSFIRHVFCKYFPPVYGLCFVLLKVSLQNRNLMNCSLSIISHSVSLVLYLKSHCQTKDPLDFLLCFILAVLLFFIFI